MQLKGLIKVFTIIFILVSIYQLSFTVATKIVENKAESFASKGLTLDPPSSLSGASKILYEDSVSNIFKGKKRYFLDSVQNETAYNFFWLMKYSYKDCRDRQLNLGLDLKGGMSLVLEISEEDVLKKLANNNPDAAFNKAVDEAGKIHTKEGGNFLAVFQEQYEKNVPNGKLANIFAAVESYKGAINFNSSNSDVIKAITKDMNSAVSETFNVLKTRIDQFGVASPTITLQANTGRIILELPGLDDPSRVRKILQQTAQLEFWDTYENEEVIDALAQGDIALGTKIFNENKTNGVDSATAAADTTGGISLNDLTSNADTTKKATDSTKSTAKADVPAKKDSSNLRPIFKYLEPNYDRENNKYGEGATIGYARGNDTAIINKYLGDEIMKTALPRDLRLLWTAKPMNAKSNVFALIAIKANPSSQEAPLTGDVITNASKEFENGLPAVSLTMNALGASKWEKMTEDAVNATVNGRSVKKCVAIVLDNQVFSSPRVQNKISGGRTQITGINDIAEADDLANILKSGKLEAKTRIIEEQVIGPSLGKEAIRSGLLSMLFGFIIVCLFMLAYYSTSGIVAVIAVMLNLFFIIGVLANFGAALTLPGMAGIVLTLAIAIDANVIINERIREELAKGKAMKVAIADGYKHSYSAIFDGNITTLLIGVVLLFFGYGPVKGFAVTLVIGILTSLFTAVGFSQIIFDWFSNRGKELKFGTEFTLNLLRGFHFKFMEKRKTFYTISAIVFAISFISMFTIGFDLGVDFKGGRSYVVKLDQDVKTSDIATALEKPLGSKPLVKTYGSNSQIQITTAYLIDQNTPEVDSIIESKLFEGLGASFAQKGTFESFRTKNIKSITRIEATIADDIRKSAFLSGLIAMIGIFIYIYFRFKKVEYATGTIAALVHDPIIVLGLFSLLRHISPFSLEIDQNVVAAILTLIGYSVNDTVIVFDRIREHLKLYPTKPLIENVNDAINTTLSRTIMTSVAAELVVLVLFIFGGDAIKQFSFAMVIGIAIGTYSSICIAAPIMVDMLLRRNKSTNTAEVAK